ncbi:MAG: hypothetical protein M3O22_02305 [Pseudomonadota bacterium]|nr:hypothetical protein [Pseudomonadota bacterium]
MSRLETATQPVSSHTVLAPARAVSFAKLIVSGEHAVVHGCPALVASLPFETRAELTPLPHTTDIHLVLPDLDTELRLSWSEALGRVQAARDRHRLFASGMLPVTSVLSEPAELALAAAVSLAPRGGWSLHLTSTVPVRAGLGSSAATIVAALKAIDSAFRLDTPKSDLWQQGRTIEALQHGRSSGTDIAAALYGGLQRFQAGHVTVLDSLALPEGWQLWYSGKSVTSTGEAVSSVAARFPSGHALWASFTQTEQQVEQALERKDWPALVAAVRENHRMLCAIGVVPDAVARIIALIEQAGGAAKICGAGAVRGDGAGAVFVLPAHPGADLPEVVRKAWMRMI